MSGDAHVRRTHTIQEIGATGQPLVLKGVDRIAAVDVDRPNQYRSAVLYTHVFSRLMRRDFNLTSIKLLAYTKFDYRRRKAVALLLDLRDEARLLEDLALPYDMPNLPVAATCPMRIISDEAEMLFDAMIVADRALHKLMHSPYAEVAQENLGPFLSCYAALRREAIGFLRKRRAD